MSAGATVAIIAAAWILVCLAPIVADLKERYDAHVQAVREAEDLARKQLDKAIASLRRERAR